jgi:hypothetical protein
MKPIRFYAVALLCICISSTAYAQREEVESLSSVLTESLELERQIILRDIEILQLRFQNLQIEVELAQERTTARVVAFQNKVLASEPPGTMYDVLTGVLTAPEAEDEDNVIK